MEKKKNEILSELYAIKAGLSVISLEKEKLQKEEENVIKSKSNINKNNENINNAKKEILHFSQVIIANQEEHDKLGTQKLKGQKKKRINLIDLVFSIGCFIAIEIVTGIIIFLKYFFVGLFSGEYKEIGAAFAKKAWPVGTIIGIVLAILYLIFKGITYKLENNESKKAFDKDYTNKKSELSNNLETAKNSLKENQDLLTELEGKTASIMESYNENLVVYDQVATVSKEATKIIYDSLVKEYSDTLDAREWKNLDLVIYYFETGRADSIKEALQLMDKQIQHEELVETLKEATNSICGSIENSINHLKDEMINCFGKLAAQMAIYQKETIKKLNKIEDKIDDNSIMLNQSIKTLSYNLNEIISQERLHNALLDKANVGSSTLVNDANYMLSYTKTARI